MKRFIAVFSAAILIFYYSVTVFSFEIDGTDSGAEWKNAPSAVLVDGESNCNVNFGLVKWSVDNEINSVYFCFMFLEPGSQAENMNAGISFFLDDSEIFTVTAGTSPVSYNSDKYSFDGAVSSDENGGTVCEIKLGMKYGIPSEAEFKVRFIDSQGNSSNVYDFTVENQPPETEETTEKTTTKTTKQITTVKPTKKTVKTTAEDKNVFVETSVAKTTKKSSNKTTKTTKKAKASTTKKTKIKTTKKKEYTTDVATVMTETNSVHIESENITEAVETTIYKISTTVGKKYKTITAIAGGSILLLVAVLGSMKINKKSNADENDPKS